MFDSMQNEGSLSSKEHFKAACKGEKPLDKYNKLNDLASQYQRQEDVSGYPKAVAIYQYLHKLIKQHAEIINQTVNAEIIDRNIAVTEANFISKVIHKQVGEDYRNKILASIRKRKEILGAYRETIKRRLQLIENFGTTKGQEELDKNELQQRVEEVEKIYKDISNFFIGDQGLIKQLLNECIAELGGIPKIANGLRDCEYAVFGMGSMSLKTMTPWSDIEFGILIEEGLEEEEKRVKDFFRNVTLLLNIKIINFGESVLHYQGIKELNDFSTGGKKNSEDWFIDDLPPKGFCFDATLPDGCKTPLGRQGHKDCDDYELIRTPTEMLEFQRDKKWQEKDMPLVQALWHTILIHGSAILLKKYQDKVEIEISAKKENDTSFKERTAFTILKQDSDLFNPKLFGIREEGALFQVKKEIYRIIDRLTVALADCLNEESKSTWEMVRYSTNIADRSSLITALAIATEIRLRTYSNNNGRIEDVSLFQPIPFNVEEDLFARQITKSFFLQNHSMLYRFFQIILQLQQVMFNSATIFELKANLRSSHFDKRDELSAANINIRFCKYTKAKECYEEALNSFQKIKGDAVGYVIFEMMLLNYLGVVCCKLSLFDEGIKYYNQIFSMLDAKNGAFTEQLTADQIRTSILANCSNAYTHKRMFAEAIQSINSAIRLQYHPDEGEKLTDAVLFNQLGEVYREKGDINEAEKHLSKALEITKKNGAIDSLYALILMNLASVDLARKNYAQALTKYKTALEIQEKEYGINHPRCADIISNIAVVYQNQGNYNQAIACLKFSLSIRSNVLGTNHTDYILNLDSLGEVLSLACNYDDAIDCYNKALLAYQEPNTSNFIGYNNCLRHLAQAYLMKGQVDNAIIYFKQAEEIWLRFSNEQSFGYAVTLGDLSAAYLRKGEFEPSQIYSSKAMGIASRLAGRNHPVFATSLHNLANAYLLRGDRTKAEDCLKELRIIRENILKQTKECSVYDYGAYAGAIYSLGNLYFELENFDNAKENYQVALKVIEDHFGNRHPECVPSINGLGNVEFCKSNLENARSKFQRCIEILNENNGENLPGYAEALYGLGNIFIEEGKHREGIEQFQRSLEIWRNTLGNNSREYVKCTQRIANVSANVALFNYNSGNILEAIFFQEQLVNLFPNVGLFSFSLARYYSIQASIFKNNADQSNYELYKEKADTSFKQTLGIQSRDLIFASFYVEYAQFLFKNRVENNREQDAKIVSLLLASIQLGDDECKTNYNQVDKSVVLDPIYALLKLYPAVLVQPYLYAYYILIKMYIVTNDKKNVLQTLENFQNVAQSLTDANEKSFADVLLVNMYKEIDIYKDKLEINDVDLKFYSSNLDIAILLSDIGIFFKNYERYEIAKKYLLAGVSVISKVHSGDHTLLAILSQNLSELYCDLGENETAITYARQSENISRSLRRQDLVQMANEKIFINILMLANGQFLQGNENGAFQNYKLISITSENLAGTLYQVFDKYYKLGFRLNLLVSCYEVLNEKLVLNNRSIKHNLACMYHAQAIKEGSFCHIEKSKELLQKAKSEFEATINPSMEGKPGAFNYVEYAMLLLKHHNPNNRQEYEYIKNLLQEAIRLGDDQSGLTYGKIDKETVVEVLKEQLNRQETISISKPYLLAYYLLIQLHLVNKNYENAKQEFSNYQSVMQPLMGRQDIEIERVLFDKAKDELTQQARALVNEGQNTVAVNAVQPIVVIPNTSTVSPITNSNQQQPVATSYSFLEYFRCLDVFNCFSSSVEVTDNLVSTTAQLSLSEDTKYNNASCFKCDLSIFRYFSSSVGVTNGASSAITK